MQNLGTGGWHVAIATTMYFYDQTFAGFLVRIMEDVYKFILEIDCIHPNETCILNFQYYDASILKKNRSFFCSTFDCFCFALNISLKIKGEKINEKEI